MSDFTGFDECEHSGFERQVSGECPICLKAQLSQLQAEIAGHGYTIAELERMRSENRGMGKTIAELRKMRGGRIKELQAENLKLSESLQERWENLNCQDSEIDQLQAENARLKQVGIEFLQMVCEQDYEGRPDKIDAVNLLYEDLNRIMREAINKALAAEEGEKYEVV